MVNLHPGLRAVRTRPVEMGKSVVEQVREDDVPFMAASIAFQAFLSLVPLLLLLFLVTAIIGGEALAAQIVALTEGFLPDAAQSLVRSSIVGTESAGVGSIIGFVVLVWGSLKIFRGLDKAFSAVYETEAENSIVDQLKDGLIVLAVLGVAIVGVVVATSLFAVFGGPLVGILNPLVLVVGLTVAFLPMYRFFPDMDLSWRDALPGAAFAAVGWTVLQALFQIYLSVSGKGATAASDVIGIVILLLTWLYFSGLVLLIAAVVNAVLLGESAESPVSDEVPRDDAERVAELESLLERERDRRQETKVDRDRLSRELEEESAWEPAPPAELTELRRQNRLLRRRLRWVEKPFYARSVLRLLGASPPAEPTLTSAGDSTRRHRDTTPDRVSDRGTESSAD